MTVTKSEIIAAMREAQREAQRVAASSPDGAWNKGVYENGWNAKQILCHIALTSYVPSFLISLASRPDDSAPEPAAVGDIDDFNEKQVAMRVGRPVAKTLEEIDRNYEQAAKLVEATPDDLISRHIRTPWGTEGTLGETILNEDLRDHVMVHLADIAAATS